MNKWLSGVMVGVGMWSAGMSVAQAGLTLDSTRVVLTQAKGETQFRARNTSTDTNFLVQSRLSRTREGRESVGNFLVSPPLFRLEAGSTNAIRLRLLSPVGLPTDRESVFYLMTQGMPASPVPLRQSAAPANGTGAGVTVGVGFSLKLFYRPTGLATPDEKVYQQATFTRVPGGVQLTNPTPYYFDLAGMAIDGKRVTFSAQSPALVPPKSQVVLATRSALKKRVSWSVKDDFGGYKSFSADIH